MTASREREVDLSTCDREPIHVPGAIQPHGVLFALSMPDLTVTQVSESVVHHLGVGVDDVLGRPLTGVLTRASAERVAAVLAHGSWRDENPLRVTAHDTEHDGILHEHDGVAILELEPARAEAGSARTHRPLLAAIQRAGTLEELSAIVVDAVKRLSKFERVMLYRFADDGSGSVDAEAKEAALEPYLGLRYPASDIPRQARELYLKSWLRIIPDRQYVPSRLVPSLRPDTGRPLDLSFSVLRSVSPIHLQYMANMGVHASMSASLIVGDRLWGLISCNNHSGPLGVPYELRSAIEVLARAVSLQIGALAEREAASIRRRRLGTRDILAGRVRDAHEDEGVLVPLLSAGAELLQLVAADGAAVVLGDEVTDVRPRAGDGDGAIHRYVARRTRWNRSVCHLGAAEAVACRERRQGGGQRCPLHRAAGQAEPQDHLVPRRAHPHRQLGWRSAQSGGSRCRPAPATAALLRVMEGRGATLEPSLDAERHRSRQ